MAESTEPLLKRKKRDNEVADALMTVGSEITLLQDVIETYFAEYEKSDDECGESDDELDLEDEESDVDDLNTEDTDGDDFFPDLCVLNEEAMDIVEVPVVMLPTLPDGNGNVHAKQRVIQNAHSEEDDRAELEAIQKFVCNCKFFKNGPCSRNYTPEEMQDTRDSMTELSRAEQEMFVLGMLRVMTNRSKQTKKTNKERQYTYTTFMVESKRVCIKTFCFMYKIKHRKLLNLQHWYKKNTIAPYKRRAGGRVKSKRLLTYEDIRRAYTFIINYAEDHAIMLPGRVSKFHRQDVLLLPCSSSKFDVYKLYCTAADEAGHRKIGCTSFRNIWLRLCPHIVRCKPATDLCWTCGKNQKIAAAGINKEICEQQLDHLKQVEEERNLYRTLVKESSDQIKSDKVKLGDRDGELKPDMQHYSFDFAQQVHLPSNPLQPGPIYFLTPRKCGIFGVCCEGIRQQINYLIDEGMCSGKGSNAVISYLHHFFATYSLQEKVVHLHCDNCSGQNKNKFMLWYLMWRALSGRHQSIHLHFMVAGHTKFAPDGNFGVLKRKFSRSVVESLSGMSKVVAASGKCNASQVVGWEDQKVEVQTYDWQKFFGSMFRPVEGIKSYHHFRFASNEPGVVYAKVRVDDPEKRIKLLKNEDNMPPEDISDSFIIKPPGLSPERQWYLYEKIREFCLGDAAKDLTCPRPTVPKP